MQRYVLRRGLEQIRHQGLAKPKRLIGEPALYAGLSPQDAEFLLNVLPSLPSCDPQYLPITLDLNGQVLIRSRDADRARPTEVRLTSSRLSGEAIVLNTDRRFVERALKFGFRDVRFYGPNSPVLALADDRRYLWAVLDSDSAIRSTADAVRIESQSVFLQRPMPTRIACVDRRSASLKPLQKAG